MLPDTPPRANDSPCFHVANAHAALARHRQNMPIGLAFNVASNPKFSHAKIFQDRGKPAEMILMRVRERDHVDLS